SPRDEPEAYFRAGLVWWGAALDMAASAALLRRRLEPSLTGRADAIGGEARVCKTDEDGRLRQRRRMPGALSGGRASRAGRPHWPTAGKTRFAPAAGAGPPNGPAAERVSISLHGVNVNRPGIGVNVKPDT